MSMTGMRWIFVALLVVVLILGFLNGPLTLGITQEWSSGNYRFAGGTHPVALAFAVVISGLYLLLMYSPAPSIGSPFPGLFRRFVAFFVDFAFAMLVIAPVIGALATLTEWKRTGTFQWSFERATHAGSDIWLTIAGILLGAVALIPYYTVPLIRGRPSPGACVTGYHVIPDDRNTLTPAMAVSRTLVGFFALSAWPLALIVARDSKTGKFWLDKVFHTRAVKLM